ncbi:MAG: NAD(P)H-hydrate epimerase, partial [Dechloromonas sp.]
MDNALYLSSSLRTLESRHADESLMQRAGTAAADWACELAGARGLPILIIAGPGNNGGDAFVAARLLRQRFQPVCVVFAGLPERQPADARHAWQAFIDAGGSTVETIPTDQRWSLIIDGLFGIGLARQPAFIAAGLIEDMNRLSRRDGCPILALDCPSGLTADTGTAPGAVVCASHTLTFITGKPGLLTADGPDLCGEIRIAPLGIDAENELPADGHCLNRRDFGQYLQPRRQNSHKGSYGSVGVLGGAPSMVGATFLAARAALKLGAGR